MLNKIRVEYCDDWINIGKCLYNIDITYLFLWVEWSQYSYKYMDEICEKIWNTFKNNNNELKINSLLLWSKTDNAEKFNEFIKIIIE